jgi:hypothetical protein
MLTDRGKNAITLSHSPVWSVGPGRGPVHCSEATYKRDVRVGEILGKGEGAAVVIGVGFPEEVPSK